MGVSISLGGRFPPARCSSARRRLAALHPLLGLRCPHGCCGSGACAADVWGAAGTCAWDGTGACLAAGVSACWSAAPVSCSEDEEDEDEVSSGGAALATTVASTCCGSTGLADLSGVAAALAFGSSFTFGCGSLAFGFFCGGACTVLATHCARPKQPGRNPRHLPQPFPPPLG